MEGEIFEGCFRVWGLEGSYERCHGNFVEFRGFGDEGFECSEFQGLSFVRLEGSIPP